MSKPSRARERVDYQCAECGWQAAKWLGRCGGCQSWGTLRERAGPASKVATSTVSSRAVPISQVGAAAATTHPTGIAELDRVLGGGLVQGAVLLLAGEPGIGKSTLLLEVGACAARGGIPTLYVTGEESPGQVGLRARRTGALCDQLLLAAETDVGAVLSHLDSVRPQLLVIDSVQAMASTEVDGVSGGVTQVREVAGTLVREAKARGITTWLIGHVTKDGSIAGPRLLEHLVDVVLHFDGERHSRLRMVRAVKNRYGPVDEVGCFELSEDGITEVSDPTGLFVSRHTKAVAGTCVTVTMEGRRPLLVEVQALVAGSAAASPRRATTGLDSSRTAMVVAVLERRAAVHLRTADVYAATVGGARLSEPAADLGIAVAIASAAADRVVPPGLVAVGEVGLAGELRRVPGLGHRLAEARRLGFTTAVVPVDQGPAPAGEVDLSGLRIVEVPNLPSALHELGLTESPRSAPATAGRSASRCGSRRNPPALRVVSGR